MSTIHMTISFALENFAFSDAIFLSERLHAEVGNDESLYMLANSYYRSGKANVAYMLLTDHETLNPTLCKSPQCLFLLGKCCYDEGRYGEALTTLTGPFSHTTTASGNQPSNYSFDPTRHIPAEELTKFFGELSSFVAQLLGAVFLKLDGAKIAAHYYTVSLKINPFLWSSYEKLLQIDPSAVEPAKLFVPSATAIYVSSSSNNSGGGLALNNYFIPNNSHHNNSHHILHNSTHHQQQQQQQLQNQQQSNHQQQQSQQSCGGPLRRSSRLYSNNVIKENTAGAPGLGQAVVGSKVVVGANVAAVVNLGHQINANKPIISTRTPTKRSRRKISFEKSGGGGGGGSGGGGGCEKDSQNENQSHVVAPRTNENLKVVTSLDLQSSKAPMKASAAEQLKLQQVQQHLLAAQQQQRTAAAAAATCGLLELMVKFGAASKLLAQFRCREAIEEFGRLPAKQAATGYVLAAIGRAYFEMSKYDEAIAAFKRARLEEPYRLQGMEIYSTALWHKQKEVELSCLAQTLIDFDKTAPETWCVAGNCFSLQKEHEISIKFLKRAIQVDPDFCYAYTLLGHEHVSCEELDNAMACFNNAIRLDGRHYNAWYGIGMIFYKQEKYPQAYANYKRALEISPYNPILMCHLAIVCHHMKKSTGGGGGGGGGQQERKALELLDKASALDPNNALVKFHRASINFATENYKVAMDELEELKKVVPRESMVYFLIGKIHKVRGDTHLALMNFSWAMDLDPKGANNPIKEMIDRNYVNDEEIMIHSSSLPEGGNNGEGGGGGGGGGGRPEGSGGNLSTPGTSSGGIAAHIGMLAANLTPLQERSSAMSPAESASSSSGSSLSPAPTPSGGGGGGGGSSELGEGGGGGGSSSLLSAGSGFGDSSLI